MENEIPAVKENGDLYLSHRCVKKEWGLAECGGIWWAGRNENIQGRKRQKMQKKKEKSFSLWPC